MTGPDASWHEMPGFTLPGRLGRDADEQLLDTILAGLPLPPFAPREYHVVAEQLSDLAGPAGPGPLPGETAALAAFSSSVSSGSLSPAGTRPATGRPARRSPARRRAAGDRTGLLTAARVRIATAVAALGVVLGTTAAAYGGELPARVQDFAHRIIDAPAAHHQARPPHPVSARRPRHQHVRPGPHWSHQPHGEWPIRQAPPGSPREHRTHPWSVRPAGLPWPAHGRVSRAAPRSGGGAGSPARR
jgi:hypothetical protein